MRKAEKLRILKFALFVVLAFVSIVLIGSYLPYTEAVEPEVIGSLQKFVEWSVRAKDWIIGNIWLLALILVPGIYLFLNVKPKTRK